MAFPRISFGVIVLNGEPFTRYALRSLYPFAHQIIVVEGANRGSAALATPDGHSKDGTLESIQRFIAEEDPEKKVILVTRDGFWSEKDEQSRAYAERATGEYLWQVDIDEFYQPEDMRRVGEILQSGTPISAASFKQIQFWGGFDYYVDGWYLRHGAENFHRLFRWGPGYAYQSHRPPTVLDAQGQDTRSPEAGRWLTGAEMAAQNVRLYHYSLVFPKQVREKCAYYAAAEWSQRTEANRWAEEDFMGLKHPFRLHNVYDFPGWLERFSGTHPPQIEQMRADLKSGTLKLDLRPTQDIEALLSRSSYRMKRGFLKVLSPFSQNQKGRLRSNVKRILKWLDV